MCRYKSRNSSSRLRSRSKTVGLATEVATACLALGRQELHLGTIVAVTSPTNLASQHALKKAGLVYEREFIHGGTLSALFRTRGFIGRRLAMNRAKANSND